MVLLPYKNESQNEKQKYGIHLFIFLRFRMNTKTYVAVSKLSSPSLRIPRRYGIEIRNDVLF